MSDGVHRVVVALVFLASLALATTPSQAVNEEARRDCRRRLEALITTAGVAMGIDRPFGFEVHDHDGSEGFTPSEEEGRDAGWFLFSTSVFHIDEGYLSGSGASALVKFTSSSCVIHRLSISHGKP